jgi:hypothetical protein
MSNAPPIAGALFETLTAVILFAAALITLATELKPSEAVQTCVEPLWPGLPFQTSTVKDCAEAEIAVAVS